MQDQLILLPSGNPEHMRLVRMPRDYEAHEAYRHLTGLIAAVEQDNPDYTPEELLEALADHGFTAVDFVLGPEIG